MPLADGNVHFARWRDQDDPDATQVEAMRAWLNHLPVNPRQEPSELVPREHPHPQDELRLAWLIDADAFVVYTVDVEDRPNVLSVDRNPPEGLGPW
jgi:hypothetical protein